MTRREKADLRQYVMRSRGVLAQRVRILANGEVHAYGRFPNTSAEGWMLFGYAEELLAMLRAEQVQA